MTDLTHLSDEEWKSVLGESIHTGFRKGSDHPQSADWWKKINDMPDDLWDDVLGWTVYCLKVMGLIQTKED